MTRVDWGLKMVQAAKGTRRTGPGAPAGRKILASAATKKKSRQSDSLVANGRKKTVSVAKVTFGKKLRDFVFPPKQAKCAQQRDPTLFEKRVYVACSQIPPGQVSTYGNLAAFLNSSARAVGGALRKNPYYPIVPCHRVVASTMELGGFNGTWGAASPEVGAVYLQRSNVCAVLL